MECYMPINNDIDDISELAESLHNLYCDEENYLVSMTITNGEIIQDLGITENSIFIKRKHLNALKQAGDDGINATGKYCKILGKAGLEVDHVPSEESLRKMVFNEGVPNNIRRQLQEEKSTKNSNGKPQGFAKYMEYGRKISDTYPGRTINRIAKITSSMRKLKQVETLSYAVAITKDEHEKYSTTYHNIGINIARQKHIDKIDINDGLPYQEERALFDKENPEAAVYRDIKSIVDNTALIRINNSDKTLIVNKNYSESLGHLAKYHDNILDALDRIGAYIKLYRANIEFQVFDVTKTPALKYSSKENMPAMYFQYGNENNQHSIPIDAGVTFKPSKKSHTAGEKMDCMLLNRIKKVLSI